MFVDIDQQQLIYIKGKEKIGKNRIIKVIEIRFILFSKKKELIISTSTSSTTNS